MYAGYIRVRGQPVRSVGKASKKVPLFWANSGAHPYIVQGVNPNTYTYLACTGEEAKEAFLVFAVRLDPQHPEVTSDNVVDSAPMLLTESSRAIDTASARSTAKRQKVRGAQPRKNRFFVRRTRLALDRQVQRQMQRHIHRDR